MDGYKEAAATEETEKKQKRQRMFMRYGFPLLLIVVMIGGSVFLPSEDVKYRVEGSTIRITHARRFLRAEEVYTELLVDMDTVTELSLVDVEGPGEMIDGKEGRNIVSGTWESPELGAYRACVYTDCPRYVVFRTEGGAVAFNLQSAEDTEKLYQGFREILDSRP